MKKATSVALLLAFLLSAFTSCGGSSGSEETTDSGETTVSDSASLYDENGFLLDELPSDLKFGGEEINIYVRGDNLESEYNAEQSGDIVDNAIYDRNMKVEERLGVTLNYFTNTTADIWNERNKFVDTVRASVMANDGTIDLVGALSYMAPYMAQEGLFYNLTASDMPYLDFSAPWWSQSLTEELAVGDKLYYASGDASLGLIKGMFCIYFNKQLVEDYKLGDPYELALSGSWSLDTLNEMSQTASVDLNGDTVIDEADRFGLVILSMDFIPNFLISSDRRITEKNASGIPETVLGTEKVIDFFDRMAELMSSDAVICSNESASVAEPFSHKLFAENRALFLAAQLSTSEQLRDLESDYGVLPYPKFDENQESYLTTSRSTYTAFSIPITSERDTVAAVLEALASEGYRTVTPAYYEKALKVKYSRDDISAQMFDLIRESVCFEFGIFHGILLNNVTSTIRNTILNKSSEWASTWAENEVAFNTLLDDYIATITALEQ